MTIRHSLFLTMNNSSAMKTESNFERAQPFLATKNNYAVLKISYVGKHSVYMLMKNSYVV